MIKDFISVYEDAVTAEYCERFIKLIEYSNANSILFDEKYDHHVRDHQTINYSHGNDFDLLAGDHISQQFLPLIRDCVSDYLQSYSLLKQERLIMYDVKAKKIPIGGGFHQWHYENDGLLLSPRKVVIQLYLNTIEEGGETEFLYINKRVKAKQGSVLIFPAAFTHTHRGNPPIGKDKYILTSWLVSQAYE
tara:strand:+ start:464 stop:1036 length:573 start_codon:yes stop_codon:yes gene_type:complete